MKNIHIEKRRSLHSSKWFQNITGVLFLIFFFSLSCSYFQTDPDFDNDLIHGPENFEYDPTRLPVLNQTTEKEILNMYSSPSTIWSFKKPMKEKIMGEYIQFDKIFTYLRFKTEKINGGGYVGQDYMYFYVFLKSGVVKQFIVHHLIKDAQGEWIKGMYSNLPTGKKIEDVWESRLIVGDCYWSQRRDRIKFIGQSTIQCPYWDAVPAY